MVAQEIIDVLVQFGAAGLMGAMWLVERRASAKREAQLGVAHEKLLGQLEERAALIEVVRDNTRALAMLESGQRGLADALRAARPAAATTTEGR